MGRHRRWRRVVAAVAVGAVLAGLWLVPLLVVRLDGPSDALLPAATWPVPSQTDWPPSGSTPAAGMDNTSPACSVDALGGWVAQAVGGAVLVREIVERVAEDGIVEGLLPLPPDLLAAHTRGGSFSPADTARQVMRSNPFLQAAACRLAGLGVPSPAVRNALRGLFKDLLALQAVSTFAAADSGFLSQLTAALPSPSPLLLYLAEVRVLANLTTSQLEVAVQRSYMHHLRSVPASAGSVSFRFAGLALLTHLQGRGRLAALISTVSGVQMTWDLGAPWRCAYEFHSAAVAAFSGDWYFMLPSLLGAGNLLPAILLAQAIVESSPRFTLSEADNHALNEWAVQAAPHMSELSNPSLLPILSFMHAIPSPTRLREAAESWSAPSLAEVLHSSYSLILPLGDWQLQFLRALTALACCTVAGLVLEVLGLFVAGTHGDHDIMDGVWQSAQACFSLFVSVGIYAQAEWSLPILLVGLWKFGCPELLTAVAVALHMFEDDSTPSSMWHRVASALNAIGLLVHHTGTTWLVLCLTYGIVKMDTPVLAATMPLTAQHFCTFLKYVRPTAYVLVQIVLEAWWEMEVLTNQDYFSAWYNQLLGGCMMASHWLWLIAGVIELLHPVPTPPNAEDPGSSSRAKRGSVVQMLRVSVDRVRSSGSSRRVVAA